MPHFDSPAVLDGGFKLPAGAGEDLALTSDAAGNAGWTLGPGSPFSMLEDWGHSLIAAGGTSTSWYDKGFIDRVASRLGVAAIDRSKGGATLAQHEQVPAATAGNGGWGRVLNDLSRYRGAGSYLTQQNGYFPPESDLILFGFGLNDIPQWGPAAAALEPIRRAFRSIINRARASFWFDDTDSSITYTGAWTATSGQGMLSSGGTWHSTATNGDSFSIAVPALYKGTPINLDFISSAQGYGALWTIAVDGVTYGTIDTRNVQPTQYGGGSSFLLPHSYRITGLAPGAHTITVTATTVNNTAYFDGWSIEAQTPPIILVQIQPRALDAGYHIIWGNTPYHRNDTTLAAAVNIGDATCSVANIQPYASQPIGPIQVGDTFTVEEHGANAETFTVGAIAGTTITLAGGATFAKAHAAGAAVSAGWQDADVLPLNAMIRGVIGEYDQYVIPVEHDAALNKNPVYYSSDSTHPNDLGHAVMAQNVIDTVKTLSWNVGTARFERNRAGLSMQVRKRIKADPTYSDNSTYQSENYIQPQKPDVAALDLQGQPGWTAAALNIRDSAGTANGWWNPDGSVTANAVMAGAKSGVNRLLLGLYAASDIYFGDDQKHYLFRPSTTDGIRAATTDAAVQAFGLKLAASQSGVSWDLQNSAGTRMASFDASGNFTAGTLTAGVGVTIGNVVGYSAVAFGSPGNTTIYNIATGALLLQSGGTSTQTQLQIKQIASQATDVFQILNSAGTVLSKIDSTGALLTPKVYLGTTDTPLYRAAGSTARLDAGLVLGSANLLDLSIPGTTANVGGTGVGDKIALYGGGAGIQHGIGVQANSLVAYVPSGGTNAFAVRAASTTGAASSGADIIRLGVSGGISQVMTNPSVIGQMIKGAASQTADLFQAQNSAGTVIANITAAGHLNIGAANQINNGGWANFGNAAGIANGIVSATALGANNIPFVGKGAASQTGDMLQLQNSAGTVIAGIDATGRGYFGTTGALSAASMTVKPTGTGSPGLVVRGVTSQAADIVQCQTPDAVEHFGIDQNGLPKWAAAGDVQTTIGAAGAASALPATPLGYLKVNIGGTVRAVPYYNAS